VPRDAAASWGIRPRSSRFATSDVMNTVLPARDRPVTPRRITGSEKGREMLSPMVWMLRAMPPAMS